MRKFRFVCTAEKCPTFERMKNGYELDGIVFKESCMHCVYMKVYVEEVNE